MDNEWNDDEWSGFKDALATHVETHEHKKQILAHIEDSESWMGRVALVNWAKTTCDFAYKKPKWGAEIASDLSDLRSLLTDCLVPAYDNSKVNREFLRPTTRKTKKNLNPKQKAAWDGAGIVEYLMGRAERVASEFHAANTEDS